MTSSHSFKGSSKEKMGRTAGVGSDVHATQVTIFLFRYFIRRKDKVGIDEHSAQSHLQPDIETHK